MAIPHMSVHGKPLSFNLQKSIFYHQTPDDELLVYAKNKVDKDLNALPLSKGNTAIYNLIEMVKETGLFPLSHLSCQNCLDSEPEYRWLDRGAAPV